MRLSETIIRYLLAGDGDLGGMGSNKTPRGVLLNQTDQLYSRGETPLNHIHHAILCYAVGEKDVRPDRRNVRGVDIMPESIWNLAQRCWIKDPEDRPNASEVSSTISIILAERPEAAHSPVPLPTSPITCEDSMRRTQADDGGCRPFSSSRLRIPGTSACSDDSIALDASGTSDDSDPRLASVSSVGFDSGYGTYTTEPLITPLDDLGSPAAFQHHHCLAINAHVPGIKHDMMEKWTITSFDLEYGDTIGTGGL